MTKYNFEVMPMSWFKRRTPTDTPLSVTHYEVLDFKKEDQHICSIHIELEDGSSEMLRARVSRACTYDMNGNESNIRWTIQGTNPFGCSILLKVLD